MTAVTGGVFDASVLTILNAAEVLSFSSTGMVLTGSKGLDFGLTGTDLGDFDAQGIPHSGTITGFQVIHADRAVISWTNMNTSADAFFHDVQALDLTALGQVVYAGADKFDVVGSIDGAPPSFYEGFGGDDLFHVNLSLHGAAITLRGDAGNDTFNFDANFDAATDSMNGGKGFDTLNLTGGSAADLTFGATSIVNVEKIGLSNANNFTITMNDGNVAKGARLSVDASQLINHTLTFDGHTETNGFFTVHGGASNDVLIGGQQADILSGAHGNDTLTGGLGADVFKFTGKFGQDTVTDFAATGAAHDVLNFAGDFGSFAALQPHMTQNDTGDVIIALDASNSIVLQHVTLADLTAADFTFG
ncbi:MAG TPA: hypothetical protein VGG10_19780 [Rhizomicrobium sp.]|jgi:Ca2+-binding RTX toxin-like protein